MPSSRFSRPSGRCWSGRGSSCTARTTCTRRSRRTRCATCMETPTPLKHRRVPDMPWAELGEGMAAAGWLDVNNQRGRVKAGERSTSRWAACTTRTSAGTATTTIAGPTDPTADLRLVVMHSPEPQVMDRFAADGYDLLLAGHTHGGQVCLPGYGTLVTNCGIDRRAGQRAAPASCPGRAGPAVAARVGRARDLTLGAVPVLLPAGGNACSRWFRGSARLPEVPGYRDLVPLRRAAGCGAAWQRASFGTKRPPVQIRPPRPGQDSSFERSCGRPSGAKPGATALTPTWRGSA